MSTISATAVKDLRDRTGLPMMDCKAALTEAGGDVNKAIEIIKAKAGKKADINAARETAEGRIATYIDPAKKIAAILELRCESAPVAKAEAFVALGKLLAKQVALANPKSVEELLASKLVDDPKKTVQEAITDTYAVLREIMKPARFARIEGLCADYIHHDPTLGVLLQVTGTGTDLQPARNVCMHIAAAKPVPVATRREDVPADVVAKELEAAKAKAAASGKPANIVEKIAEGQMKTWYGENVLVEQPFVMDQEKTVGQVLKAAGLEAVKFVRYKVGELS
jgi:elongation factor Ts